MPWTLSGLIHASGVGGDIRGDAEVAGLAYDSMTVKAGDAFCCIPGSLLDGHDFAVQAVEAGATSLVVERQLDVHVPQARVERVRSALGPIAATFYDRPSGQLDVVGVTGTNGKTTITYLVESIAKSAGLEPGVIGNVSRRYAGIEEPAQRNTPEAIDVQALLRRMVDKGIDLVALEATSDGLAAERLRGTRFRTAGFTNLTLDHLNTHGTMEAYFEAKALLFADEYTSQAVINLDDEHGRMLHERVRSSLDVLTFGTGSAVGGPSEGADIVCEEAGLSSTGSRATIVTPAGVLNIETKLVGRYNVSNCMCAIGLALQCGIEASAIAEGIAALDRAPGRLDRVDVGQPFLALVDYAHTPDALEQALTACRELATGRLLVVFGCGGDRDRTKRPLMGEIATRIADLSYITSDNPRGEDPEAIVAEVEAGAKGSYRVIVDRREAIEAALEEAREGDVVLIAGKGHEQGQQFADHTIPFDDMSVTRELLEALCLS